MTNGKTYKTVLMGKTDQVRFTVANRFGQSSVEGNCGDADCTAHGGATGETRKVEAAITSKGNLVLRRINYSNDREETYQVFESVPHMIANLDVSKPDELQLSQQLSALDLSDLSGEKAAEVQKAAAEVEYAKYLADKQAARDAAIAAEAAIVEI